MDRHRNSLTEGPIWKAMLLFALPVFLGNVFQQLYNAFDAWCVGNYIGDDALAAAELYFCLRERYFKEKESCFLPKQLSYTPKKTEPVTKRQCSYLQAIIAAKGLSLTPDYGTLTKSEASRLIDKLILKYGKP